MLDVIKLVGDKAELVSDDWALPVEGEAVTATTLIPFKDFAAVAAAAPADAKLGLLLTNDLDPNTVYPFDQRVVIVAVEFPKFTDGRGYSIAAMLRRLGWRGELRAVGDVLRDQLNLMKRVGFDSFAIAAHHDAAAAIVGLSDFTDVYQQSFAVDAPAFRRHPAGFGVSA
jgi:uncharacterized protein (DUF934 family)